MIAPTHTGRTACVLHGPACQRETRLYPSGRRCVPPDTRRDHPQAPRAEEAPR